jgi:DNA-binding MarR family transcriptional regulator
MERNGTAISAVPAPAERDLPALIAACAALGSYRTTLRRMAHAHSLTATDVHLLLVLIGAADGAGATVAEVTAQLQDTPHVVRAALRRVQAGGWVTAQPGESGHPGWLHLTPAGERLLATYLAAEASARAAVGRVLGAVRPAV